MAEILDANGNPVRRPIGFKNDEFVKDNSVSSAVSGTQVHPHARPRWNGVFPAYQEPTNG